MTSKIAKLISLRANLALLQAQEAEIMADIIIDAGHDKLGQSKYDIDGYKVTIKTGENVTLDKKKLDEEWNESMPITRKYDYVLRKKEFDDVMKHGTAAQRAYLSKIVTTKPARPSIKIEEE